MMRNHFLTLFPVWAVVAWVFAYFFPAAVVDYKTWIVPLFMIIMFCMGVTLTIADFIRAIKHPKILVVIVLLQFLLMPLAAFVISKEIGFSFDFTFCHMLVGGVLGCAASNIMIYLAKGDVALSITMTAISTLLFVAALFLPSMTPHLTWFYLEQNILVLGMNVLKVIIAPFVFGIVVNLLINSVITKIKDICALFSCLATISIIAIVVGLNHERLSAPAVSSFVVFGVVLHNLLGVTGGYYTAKLLGYEQKICRTVAIQVCMQSSGWALALLAEITRPYNQ